VAISAGIGGGSWSTLIAPELDARIRRPNNGNTMLVFALPSESAAPATNKIADARADNVTLGRTVWEGVYTAEQAGRGRSDYLQTCASCHSEDLHGVGPAPRLIGSDFSFQWSGLTVGDLFGRIQSMMPANRPNSLPSQSYRDIVAFLLQSNKFPAGGKELDEDPEALRQILITPKQPELKH
jgi:mono/diheme cytochrome c family protein